MGGELVWQSQGTSLSTLYSHQAGESLSHRIWGIRGQQTLLGTHCESAFMHQVLDRRATRGLFAAGTTGFSVWRGTRTAGWRTDLGLTRAGCALQAHAVGQIDGDASWRIAVWNISPRYRNPVLYARGESDRERISYPELDVELSSTSTGESGGEGRLKLRRGSRDTEMRLTYWREQPLYAASLRATLRHGLHTVGGRLDVTYSVRVQSEGDRQLYHVWSVGFTRSRFFATASMRRQRSATPQSERLSARLTSGLRLPPEAFGHLHVSAAYESRDLTYPDADFLTLRLDHELPVSAHGQVGLHVRWRSPYRSYGSSLSLRIATALQW
jgi:hypothetical protein